MNRDLRKSWRVTRQHLEAAKRELPKAIPRLEEGWSITRYEEWLSYNELELAFDELEGIGSEIEPGERFWKELAAAADSMGLKKAVERCRRRPEELR